MVITFVSTTILAGLWSAALVGFGIALMEA